MSTAAANLTPVSFELGGNNAALVYDGLSSEGVTTTAFPAASAGATFHVSRSSGRFQAQ